MYLRIAVDVIDDGSLGMCPNTRLVVSLLEDCLDPVHDSSETASVRRA